MSLPNLDKLLEDVRYAGLEKALREQVSKERREKGLPFLPWEKGGAFYLPTPTQSPTTHPPAKAFRTHTHPVR